MATLRDNFEQTRVVGTEVLRVLRAVHVNETWE